MGSIQFPLVSYVYHTATDQKNQPAEKDKKLFSFFPCSFNTLQFYKI